MKFYIRSSQSTSGTRVYVASRDNILKYSPYLTNIWFRLAVQKPLNKVFTRQSLGDYQVCDNDNIYIMYTDGNPIASMNDVIEDPLDLFEYHSPDEFSKYVDLEPLPKSKYSSILDSDINFGELNIEDSIRELEDAGYGIDQILDDGEEVGLDLSYYFED